MANIDFSKCQVCKHAKHIGRDCGEILNPLHPAGDDNRCKCDDIQARKNTHGKTGGWHLLPWSVLAKVAEIYDYGSRKYKANSWQDVPPDPDTGATPRERYEQAMFRHWEYFKGGEWLDPESGKPHLSHFIWNALAVFWFELQDRKKEEDRAA